jgi:hypothetical protein
LPPLPTWLTSSSSTSFLAVGGRGARDAAKLNEVEVVIEHETNSRCPFQDNPFRLTADRI